MQREAGRAPALARLAQHRANPARLQIDAVGCLDHTIEQAVDSRGAVVLQNAAQHAGSDATIELTLTYRAAMSPLRLRAPPPSRAGRSRSHPCTASLSCPSSLVAAAGELAARATRQQSLTVIDSLEIVAEATGRIASRELSRASAP